MAWPRHVIIRTFVYTYVHIYSTTLLKSHMHNHGYISRAGVFTLEVSVRAGTFLEQELFKEW